MSGQSDVTRRGFLGLTAAAAAGAACRRVPPPATPAAEPDLPPSIAALEPIDRFATPISVDERRERIERAAGLMREHRLDAILLAGGTSLRYFTGVHWGLSERLFAVVLPRRGAAIAVCPAFEEGRAREQLDVGPLEGTEVFVWQEHEDPYALLARALRERGVVSGRLGVEETVRFVFSDGVAAAAPALEAVSATPVTAGCRQTKDYHELELMRLASSATLRAFEAVYRAIGEGMTREEIGELIVSAHRRLGFRGGALVLVNESTALPHGSTRPSAVREGSVILIDGGCSVEGYRSDISRTFVYGRPSDEMRRIFDVVLRAQTTALGAARPGVECQAVDAAARAVIAEAGFGADYEHCTHRLGHGIGMDGHEWPYLVRGNTLPLAPGMTFSDEPGIYLEGKFGIRLEDDMVITREGAELLTPQSPSLEEPFAV